MAVRDGQVEERAKSENGCRQVLGAVVDRDVGRCERELRASGSRGVCVARADGCAIGRGPLLRFGRRERIVHLKQPRAVVARPDAAIVRAHEHAAGARKGALPSEPDDHAIGRGLGLPTGFGATRWPPHWRTPRSGLPAVTGPRREEVVDDRVRAALWGPVDRPVDELGALADPVGVCQLVGVRERQEAARTAESLYLSRIAPQTS